MIVCHGFPKSGTHALQKAVELLGLPAAQGHYAYGEKLPPPHVFIVRDPRNIIISWLRFVGDAVTPGKFLARFRCFQERPLAEELARYEGWLDAPGTHVVRYEPLTRHCAEMHALADFLGVPYLEGAFEALPNHTRTWNGGSSDYRRIWTKEVSAAWRAEGGDELLSRWGY